MSWSDTYLLHEDTIDSHHLKLIGAMKELEDKQSLSKIEFLEKITFLVDYAAYHFDYEETLMKQKNYPLYEVHKKLHTVFMDKINGWIEGFNNLPPIVNYDDVSEVFQFGVAWLNRHILTVDKKFVEFLNQQN